MSNDDQGDVNCAICLESFASAPFGACVPCGHCFHVECFKGWKKARRALKCPMCNTHSNGFCKIYLDVTQSDNIDANSDNSSTNNDDISDKDRYLQCRRMLEQTRKQLDDATKSLVELTATDLQKVSLLDEQTNQIEDLTRKLSVSNLELQQQKFLAEHQQLCRTTAERKYKQLEQEYNVVRDDFMKQSKKHEAALAKARHEQITEVKQVFDRQATLNADYEKLLKKYKKVEEENQRLTGQATLDTTTPSKVSASRMSAKLLSEFSYQRDGLSLMKRSKMVVPNLSPSTTAAFGKIKPKIESVTSPDTVNSFNIGQKPRKLAFGSSPTIMRQRAAMARTNKSKSR